LKVIDIGQSRTLTCVQIRTDTNITEKYCGTEVPTILSYDATSVNLKFSSDYYVTRSGFKITYKIVTRKGY